MHYTVAEKRRPLWMISWLASSEHTWFIVSSAAGMHHIFQSLPMILKNGMTHYVHIQNVHFFPLGWLLSHFFPNFPFDFPRFPGVTHAGKAYQPTQTPPRSQASMSRADTRQEPVVLSHGSWWVDGFGYPHDFGNLHIYVTCMYIYIYIHTHVHNIYNVATR